MPLVSIGVPVYNGEDYLRESLESLLSQSFSDMEIIISDNASSDGTPGICDEYARKDPRVKVFRQDENVGAARNYNFVFEKAQGKYFKWAAHDDIIRDSFVSRCLEEFDKADGTPSIVYPVSEFIDENSDVIGPCDDRVSCTSRYAPIRLFQFLFALNMATPIFGLMDREAVMRTRLIDVFVGSDYVMLAELALIGRIVRINEPLFLRRFHPAMSRQANASQEDALKWFDPRAKSSKLSIRQKLYLEYYRSIQQIRDIGSLERFACVMCLIAGIPLRRIRVVGGRWKSKLLSR